MADISTHTAYSDAPTRGWTQTIISAPMAALRSVGSFFVLLAETNSRVKAIEHLNTETCSTSETTPVAIHTEIRPPSRLRATRAVCCPAPGSAPKRVREEWSGTDKKGRVPRDAAFVVLGGLPEP